MQIDYALVSEKFFREDLARDLNAVPAITSTATAVTQNTGARATNITVHGIDSRMSAFYDETTIPGMLTKPAGQIFQSVVITQALLKEICFIFFVGKIACCFKENRVLCKRYRLNFLRLAGAGIYHHD